MDLRKVILQEHSRAQMLKIAHYVGRSPARFKQLVDVFLAGPYRVTQRGAWPLSYCVEAHPPLIKPHLLAIVARARQPDVHHAVRRNTLRLLQFCEIPKRLQGRIIDFCFESLQQKSEPVAVKVFALHVLGRLVREHPALEQELRLAIEECMHRPASPAMMSAMRNVSRALDKRSR